MLLCAAVWGWWGVVGVVVGGWCVVGLCRASVALGCGGCVVCFGCCVCLLLGCVLLVLVEWLCGWLLWLFGYCCLVSVFMGVWDECLLGRG